MVWRLENYFLKEKDGRTILNVTMDITDEHVTIFRETFPKALKL
jgi:hypothetical protein